METPITIVIVDDHPIFRRGLIALLQEPDSPRITVLAEASNTEDGLKLVEQHVPDVLLTDLQMGQDFAPALSLIRDTRQKSPTTRVLVMTGFDATEAVMQVLQAGAHGCISKADNLESAAIRHAIAEVASGGHAYSPLIFKRLYELMHQEQHKKQQPMMIELLTERESDVLPLVGDGLTNQEIADRLGVSIKTVKTHVSNILSKLHLQSRYEAALYYRAQSKSG